MKGDGTGIDVAEKIDHTVPIKKCIHPGIFSCTFIYDRANLGGGGRKYSTRQANSSSPL